MDTERLELAFTQCKNLAHILEDQYKEGNIRYCSASLRDLMKLQGYAPREQDALIRYVAEKGFNYCVDPIIKQKDEKGQMIRPPEFACVWGIDQLRSRLESV